jgi:hypothetical protein
MFRSAIRDGARRGEFRLSGSVEDAADRLISLMDGIAVRTLLGGLRGGSSRRFWNGSRSGPAHPAPIPAQACMNTPNQTRRKSPMGLVAEQDGWFSAS